MLGMAKGEFHVSTINMPSTNFVCKACKRRVPRSELEQHVNESHSSPQLRLFTVAGEEREMTEAEYVRSTVDERDEVDGGDEEQGTVAPASSIYDEMGIKLDDFSTVDITTVTGAVMTDREAKLMLEAVQDYVGFQIHRPTFVANLLDWGIRNGFTEELQEAGGFDVITDPTQPPQRKYVTAENLQRHITDYLTTKQFGRSFTFRRFGRFLGKEIPTICSKVPKLAKFYVEGSPMSNRLGVPPENFLCVTSIYEYIKPFKKWTLAERNAWEAHNRSVRKVARESDTGFLPQDLRINPSEAGTLVDRGHSDFAQRHRPTTSGSGEYGKGEDIFQRMARGQTSREGLGYGV